MNAHCPAPKADAVVGNARLWSIGAPCAARRRSLLGAGALWLVPWIAGLRDAVAAPSAAAVPASVFPADFGAHPAFHTEWWYVTGELLAGSGARFGFQVTFFRTSTGLGDDQPSRFAARQLLFAHAAVSDLAAMRLHHDQRVARAGFGIASAAVGDTAARLRDWSLVRDARDGVYHCDVASDTGGFAYGLAFSPSQPPLLQGDAGISRKGLLPAQTSHYYSVPQLTVAGRLRLDGRSQDVRGRAWLDHEWSDAYLAADAVGWDWLGMNLDDGSALTAFRIRRSDGTVLYAGGSLRRPGGAVRTFASGEVTFRPGRLWTSTASRARYPVEWGLVTPAGEMSVVALQDDQELDSRGSTGAFYWEGLSELRHPSGSLRLGVGYLEMTGYAERLRMG